MLAAHKRIVISSLVARHQRRCSFRSSRMRVSCCLLRSARNDVVASNRVQSEGVGVPTDASAVRGAACLGAELLSEALILAPGGGPRRSGPEALPLAAPPSTGTWLPLSPAGAAEALPLPAAPAPEDDLAATSSAALRSAPLGS